jgi:Cft2 family RNA processing exonuclease
MGFSVRRANGIEIISNHTTVILDAVKKSDIPIFVSHAHGDHCGGMKSSPEIYSTKATRALARVAGIKAQKNHTLNYGEKVKFDNVEVTAHNAGHILGSTQFEIASPFESAVYTGDINFRDTLLTRKAEIIPCDVLIIESTYGTPCYFPSREYMYERIVKWANFTVKTGKIPAFQTDALGNAQELIALLNDQSKIPVVAHNKVARYNRVYEQFGHKLNYLDQNSEESKELLNSKECVYVVPKNLDLRDRPEFKVAFVSGWGERFSGRRKAFSLSDHSDFYRLLNFVECVKPKVVFTCHGSKKSKITLAKKIRRTLHIAASPLTKQEQGLLLKSKVAKPERVEECKREILTNVRPGFMYPKNWLISTTCNSLRRFSREEVQMSLSESEKEGKLRYMFFCYLFNLTLFL